MPDSSIPDDRPADEGSSGCLWGCVFVLAGLALLPLLPNLGSPGLSACPVIAIGLLSLARLIPGLPRRWFGPTVTRAENAREFWVVLVLGTLLLVGGAVELWASFGAR